MREREKERELCKERDRERESESERGGTIYHIILNQLLTLLKQGSDRQRKREIEQINRKKRNKVVDRQKNRYRAKKIKKQQYEQILSKIRQ